MRANLTEEWVELIWKHSILPYLGEQFFGEEERLADFELSDFASAHPSIEPEDDATQPMRRLASASTERSPPFR